MLKDNLKQLRKSKGLTQDEFAVQLNVVRQTISKWENGLSVPDSEMLMEISNRFEIPVATLLGENIEYVAEDSIQNSIEVISNKIALINEQLIKTKERKRIKIRTCSLVGIAVVICYLIWQTIIIIRSSLLTFNLENASNSIIGGADGPTSIFIISSGSNPIFLLIIIAICLISICGICLTRKR